MADHGILTIILVAAVLLDDLVQDGIVPLADTLQALLHILKIEPPQERQVIGLVSQAHELQHLRHGLSELPGFLHVLHVGLLPVKPLPGYHSHHVVVGQVVEHGSYLHASKILARVPGQPVNQAPGLVASDSGERVDSLGGENVEGGDATEVAPVVTVGTGTDGGVVVENVFSGERGKAVGQGKVVFGETFLECGV
ncbi:hypothetical protein V8G54_008193 [Vigna mungo]|uniref:Secreted protein n=1 Tax=Vigna mungo TaxID=3915 RepID=A0AAQ3P4S2_VIGMU